MKLFGVDSFFSVVTKNEHFFNGNISVFKVLQSVKCRHFAKYRRQMKSLNL